MIRTLRDTVEAYDDGRYHAQRFIKSVGTTGDGQWHDWSYASGQPSYDARIGSALAFTPFIASGNDAIFFPTIPDGMERKLAGIDLCTVANSISTTNVSFHAYDLLGVYPLIDGDNTDVQLMDNALPVPRYPDGAQAVLVNHVSPSVNRADILVEYENQDGAAQTVTWYSLVNGVNKVNYALSATGAAGPIYCALANGDRAVRKINSVQFQSAAGGLWAIYIVKPIADLKSFGSNLLTAPSAVNDVSFLIKDGFKMQTIKDGAWLGFFFNPQTGGRAYSIYGQAHFIWG